MAEVEWFRSHVERLLQDEWEQCELLRDNDGDYPFRYGTAACYVQVHDGPPLMARVFAYAVVGVKRSARLLQEINDVNGRTKTAHVYWAHGAVMVEQALVAHGVTPVTLGQALHAVAVVADDIGLMIASVFGGETPFEPCDAVDEEECA